MSYTIDVDPIAQATIDVFPPALLDALADAFSLLAIAPWSAPSIEPVTNPDGAVRTMRLGPTAMVTHLVLEDQRRVDVLRFEWIG